MHFQSCLVEKSELHGKHNTSQDELREARESFSNATVEIDEMRKAAKDSKRLVDHLQEELKVPFTRLSPLLLRYGIKILFLSRTPTLP